MIDSSLMPNLLTTYWQQKIGDSQKNASQNHELETLPGVI